MQNTRGDPKGPDQVRQREAWGGPSGSGGGGPRDQEGTLPPPLPQALGRPRCPACRARVGRRYLWFKISTVPYCSIHSFPMITLCTQQVGLVQV